ncbi:hypothetical protein Cs7R123_24980 [Catellatospora sp. TT07R-123]|uniref:hypothetical protein n=1 Tax=Catellatospora sp. TT07R-123 TaxID=2733863 RepID=UPI001B228E40|nr:hypothetical protein [Catellatospora sp. TT07R-123]GHJ45156.1 hypothetical protein Cs7R123_24980 [Catellatospora sp. TT07R-123]
MTRFAPLAGVSLTAVALSLAVAVPAHAAPATVTWSTANSVATGDQDGAAVATNRNGYVAVVWEDDRDTTAPADNAHSEIFLRLFKDGTAVYEKQLSTGGTAGTSWKHITPDVALDDKGNAVVVWADDPDGNGAFNIPYQVVGPTGTVLGSGRANASTAGNQIVPKVAVDPDGSPSSTTAVAFTVVWEDIADGATVSTVKAAGFTNVTTKAYEVTASQTTGTHHRPDVAVSASGDALVVWDEDADANAYYNIGLVRLARANGAVNLTRRAANFNGGNQQWHASIAADFTGDFTVAWESDHTGTAGVWARSFKADGTARHNDVEVSSEAGAVSPSVGIDDQANTVVAWTTPANGLDVWARGYNPDGTTAGRLAAQSYTDTTTGRQEQGVVAVSAWGEIALCFTDDNDGNLFDQIRMGLGGLNSDW